MRERTAIPPELLADLRSNIKRLSGLSLGTALAAKASAFDSTGTELWNGTTNILRDTEDPPHEPRLRRDGPNEATVLLRVFAFYLLDVAYRTSPRRTKDVEQRMRNFKVALKTCQSCLSGDELELALKVLEKCSDHVSAVETASPLLRLTNEESDGGAEVRMKPLATEYHLLRIMHSWKSNRLDLAAHFTAKLDFGKVHSAHLPEKAADLFYEIGKFLLKQSDAKSAGEWLERALRALDACDIEHLSDDAPDLRLSIGAKLGEPSRHMRSLSVVLTIRSEMPVLLHRQCSAGSYEARGRAAQWRSECRQSPGGASDATRRAACRGSNQPRQDSSDAQPDRGLHRCHGQDVQDVRLPLASPRQS